MLVMEVRSKVFDQAKHKKFRERLDLQHFYKIPWFGLALLGLRAKRYMSLLYRLTGEGNGFDKAIDTDR